MKTPLVIAISGMSGSGKTTVSTELQNLFGRDKCTVVSADRFHLYASDMNFSDPNNKDTKALNEMVRLVRDLKNGIDSEIQGYDFHSKRWTKKICHYPSREVVIIEGILTLCVTKLRDLLDYSVFLDLPLEVGKARRLQRSGGSENELRRWKTVSQQYLRDIDSCKKYADLVLDPESTSAEEQAKMIFSVINRD